MQNQDNKAETNTTNINPTGNQDFTGNTEQKQQEFTTNTNTDVNKEKSAPNQERSTAGDDDLNIGSTNPEATRRRKGGYLSMFIADSY